MVVLVKLTELQLIRRERQLYLDGFITVSAMIFHRLCTPPEEPACFHSDGFESVYMLVCTG